MADLPGNIGGFVAWGGNPPMSEISADGAIYYGRNDKSNNGSGTLYYSVYRMIGDTATVAWRSAQQANGTGQGTLKASNGQLIATYFPVAGDNQPSMRVVVPGYVPFPAAQGPTGATGATGPQGPQGEPGPAGSGGGSALETEQIKAIDWLIGKLRWLGVLL